LADVRDVINYVKPGTMFSRLAAIIFAVVTLPPSGAMFAQTATPASVSTMPSITLPPAFDQVLRAYERAWRAGDEKALAALFTADGFVLQPGRLPVRGRAGLESTYRGQGGGALRLRPLALLQGDSVAAIIGAYGYGDTPDDQGKFTLTLRRQRGGAWLIFSDMDNGSQPARRPQDRL
jgi:ketosteroid isomerase-like protein